MCSADPRPALSVVICTLDRPDLVRQAVQSLTTQTLPASRFEVVVIDNGSGGTVAAALTDLHAALGNLRVVEEPVLGLSQARNRGIREAVGDVVLFLDDDAEGEPELLERHLERFEGPAAAAATGGRILLRWPADRPAWVPTSQEGYYSALDLGEHPLPMVFPVYPYGANMAIRRDLLVELGGFSLELGRVGTNLISGEEKDLFARIAAGGGRVDYVPDALVHHHVLPDRTRPRWLLRRAWAQGRSEIAMRRLTEEPLGAARTGLRAGLHLSRGLRLGARWAVAVATRQDAAVGMERASRALRSLGAAYEGGADGWRARPGRRTGPSAG